MPPALDGPISASETIVVQGAGFGSDAQLLIGGAVGSGDLGYLDCDHCGGATECGSGCNAGPVQSSGGSSNQVLMPVAAVSPGIFSQDGNGYGQAYILNKDGTLSMPSNPAAPGDQITIFATGVGPVPVTQGNAVTQFSVTVWIEGTQPAMSRRR
jgi:hypothetical protein